MTISKSKSLAALALLCAAPWAGCRPSHGRRTAVIPPSPRIPSRPRPGNPAERLALTLQEPKAPARKPDTPRTSEFPYAVKFEQGVTRFLDGDTITILEVRGTADTIMPGNIYWIKGTYTLASHDRAMLAAYTTARAPRMARARTSRSRRPSSIGARDLHALPADVLQGLAACQLLPGRRGERFRRQLFRDGRFRAEEVVGVEPEALIVPDSGPLRRSAARYIS